MLFTAQKFVEKREKWDPWRSARFSTIGIFWVGPYVRFALNKINSLTKFWPAKARIQRGTVMNPFFFWKNRVLLSQKDSSRPDISHAGEHACCKHSLSSPFGIEHRGSMLRVFGEGLQHHPVRMVLLDACFFYTFCLDQKRSKTILPLQLFRLLLADFSSLCSE